MGGFLLWLGGGQSGAPRKVGREEERIKAGSSPRPAPLHLALASPEALRLTPDTPGVGGTWRALGFLGLSLPGPSRALRSPAPAPRLFRSGVRVHSDVEGGELRGRCRLGFVLRLSLPCLARRRKGSVSRSRLSAPYHAGQEGASSAWPVPSPAPVARAGGPRCPKSALQSREGTRRPPPPLGAARRAGTGGWARLR